MLRGRGGATFAVVAIAVAVAGQAHGTGAAVYAHPRCFGAAARDPAHACDNPSLRLVVRPTPSEAQITPSAPCTRLAATSVPACTFGADVQKPLAVALVGDSHADQWRAALEIVARTDRWPGLSMTRASCPFSRAIKVRSGPKILNRAARRRCIAWRGGVRAELARHPEIHTVFVAENSRGQRVAARRGERAFHTEVKGYLEGWRRFPATVRRIVVIRDTPRAGIHTFACIRRAVRRHQPPGPACALRRTEVLAPDPAVVAAGRYHADRARAIDMTHYFCDSELCYPVIGGALVFKDLGHMTRTYAATLGPFLTRKVDDIIRTAARTASSANG